MARKLLNITNTNGRAFRVTVGTKSSNVITPERIIDPTGFLTVSSPPGSINEEDKAAISATIAERKRKIQSGEIVISYP